jgi:hypothetical protein
LDPDLADLYLYLENLAGQEGLEPPTLGFGDRCSTIMSYWPVSSITSRFP